MTSALSLSDRSFLSLFNIPTIQSLLSDDEIEPAKIELLNHYRNRIENSWPRPPHSIHNMDVTIDELASLQLDQLSTKDLIHHANAVLEYKFSDGGVYPKLTSEGRLAWHSNPTQNPEWLWWLNRHHWWVILGLAYFKTGDERYARAFVDQLLDWIKQNPPPPEKNESSPSWRLMEVALRMRICWIPCFGLFFQSLHFNSEAKLMMLRSIYDHAHFLSLFQSQGNHLLRESNGLAYASIYFPEFHDSMKWQNIALSRLERELGKQINEDGSHIEMSTGYQLLVIEEFEKTYHLLDKAGLNLPNSDLSYRLPLLYGILAKIVRPDGSFPELNDGFIGRTSQQFTIPGKLFERDDFLYIGTGGKQGTIPPYASTAIRDAGVFVMRSDWTNHSKFLLFDAGPYGGFHGHEDKLSIEVYANGQPFIVDPGSYTYDPGDPFRLYFMSSQGHNTVLVDGLSQVRRWDQGSMNPQKKAGNYGVWITEEKYDYVSSTYNGDYGVYSLKKPEHPDVVDDVIHIRKIVFVKPHYWIMIDELNSSGTHSYQFLFHTHPEVHVTFAGNRAILSSKSMPARLLLVPADSDDMQTNCMSGSENPIQGWYSDGPFRKVPASTVVYEKRNSSSTVCATLMYPYTGSCDYKKIELNPVPVSENKSCAYEVKTDIGTDYIMFSSNDRMKHFADYQSKAKVACVRTDIEGHFLCRFENSLQTVKAY